ncbi:hypothetical protein COBT_003946, partial [Conglomerata obtusa]
MDKYFLSEDNRNYVIEFIKLRYFIAKKNNESIDYVMNDKQLLDLIFTQPLNREDFVDCLGRMSALVREHMCDIILIIKKTMEANNMQNNIEIEEKNYFKMKVE